MPWDSLTTREQIGLAMLVAGNLIIAVQLGKYGRILVARRGSAWMGAFIVLAGLFTTGKGKVLEDWWMVGGIIVLSVAAFVITRLAARGSPQIGYERALLAMKQWTRYNYAHLKKLPEKGIRSNNSRALATLSDLQAAVTFFGEDSSPEAKLKQAIAQLESGLMLRMMNKWAESAVQLDGSISCLYELDARPPCEEAREVLSIPTEKHDDEKACRSLTVVVAIDQCFAQKVGVSTYPDPRQVIAIRKEAQHRNELVRSLAAALFRRAELYHVTGSPAKALPLYRKALAIHERLKDTVTVEAIRKLVNLIA